MPPSCTSRTQPSTQNRRSKARHPEKLKIIQQQVGHAYASITGLYTHVSNDFKHKTVQQMIAHRTTPREQ